MNKKGQGLPMNVVIIGIIGVVVLLLVLLIFFGGAKWIKETMLGMGAERMKGTDITLAQQQCDLYCDYAKELSGIALKNSAYCTTKFKIEGKTEEMSCKELATCGVTCPSE